MRLLFLSSISQQYAVMFPWKPEFAEDDAVRKIEYPRTTITLLRLQYVAEIADWTVATAYLTVMCRLSATYQAELPGVLQTEAFTFSHGLQHMRWSQASTPCLSARASALVVDWTRTAVRALCRTRSNALMRLYGMLVMPAHAAISPRQGITAR
ncbi:hypothetical protein NM688_g7874 [Phlebia brevispora]|uniref:Uncharacterized protein n=1 Tax=Phlebia brevispora TaxID=194682 RepID=A0ACC1S044_9APHY|nr:hypothetical protein NM688_g7874 [Phlebia brevispora]